MRVGVIGISYKTSELNLREKLAKTAHQHVAADYWNKRGFVYVLLSTCNRTEIYFSADDLAEAHSELLALLRQDVTEAFEHKLYSYFGSECFNHLAKVTSGLDSVILGESEIQRQVKQSYENACLFQTLPSCMHHLFQKSLKIGKEIRTTFALPKNAATIEGVVVDLAKLFFVEKQDPSILFVGHSEINRKILHYLKGKKFSQIALASRNLEAARELLQKCAVRPVEWGTLSSEWKQYDIVICGTNQKEYLISRHQAQKGAKTKLIIDLSMPRSVDPRLAQHSQISLFNIEEMSRLIDQKQKISMNEVQEISEMVHSKSQKHFFLYHLKTKKDPACAFSSVFS